MTATPAKKAPAKRMPRKAARAGQQAAADQPGRTPSPTPDDDGPPPDLYAAALAEVLAGDGFDADEALRALGVDQPRALTVGGRRFLMRRTLDVPESAQLLIALRGNAQSEALRILLVDREELPDLLGSLRLPVDPAAETAFWNALLMKMTGADLGESAAS